MLFRSSDGPTILKRRFVESYHFTKLLEVYEIEDAAPREADELSWARLIAREAPRQPLQTRSGPP